MKRIYTIIFAAVALFSACEEFQPVFTGKYPLPAEQEVQVLEPTHTILELAQMCPETTSLLIEQDIIIAGKVTTTDQPGNLYKSLYIQDETCGIEVKIGRNGLYNEYKVGQTIYVRCNGLTIGTYGYKTGNYGGAGTIQIGFSDPTGEYQTSYLEHIQLVDHHIVKGPIGDPVQPEVITESQLPGQYDNQKHNRYVGKLVTLKGLKYANQCFNLLYLDSNKDKKASSNRIFLSDQTWGITTWSMSKQKMTEYLYSGIWDSCKIGNSGDYNYGTVGDHRVVAEDGTVSYPTIEKTASSGLSQSFMMGSRKIDIRTSGYCKFSDTEIDPRVLSGEKTIDVTGILSVYQDKTQFTLLDLSGVVINE